MAIKTRNQATTPEPANVLTEERQLRVNPELDIRLNAFMEKNAKTTAYYTQLVKENPERAVRSIMLGKMQRYENEMRLVERQLPQVKEWVNQQPGLFERIKERIKNVNPLYQEKAFVNEAMRAKSRVDFAPLRTGVSQAV
jgi:hypothetical protein